MEIFDNKELVALISLLDDPDFEVVDKIRERIFSYGTDAIPVLESAWENSFDSTMQVRIENIIHKLQFENLFVELNSWYHFNRNDLLKGYMLITRHQYPDLDEESIVNHIEKIRKDVWLELNDHLTALEKINVINHIFYEVNLFRGNKRNVYSPQNIFINTLLETHKGNPLSLGILYIIVAQALEIPVYGVNLPQHFILAYANDDFKEEKKITDLHNILFYINPFNKGTIFTKKEIELFIKQMKIKSRKSYFLPCDNVTIINRLIHNLIYTYERLEYSDKIDELKELTKAFK